MLKVDGGSKSKGSFGFSYFSSSSSSFPSLGFFSYYFFSSLGFYSYLGFSSFLGFCSYF